jgi:[ribosomal protein S5]-alanine N-acetyltransferase
MFTQYNTERLVITPFTTDDDSFILELLNTEGWIKNIGDKKVNDKESAAQYINAVLGKSYQDMDCGFYKVALADNHLAIGMCGLYKRDYLPFHDLGFAFLPAYHKKGYAIEAASHILDKESQRLDFHKIGAICLPDNEDSISLLGKLSFQYITTLEKDNELLAYYEADV